MMEKVVIKLCGVSRNFYGSQVLQNVSFEIAAGTFCSLIGENGAGKSTLLNILMGLESFDEGEGVVLGKSIYLDLGVMKNEIGFVSEKINYDLPIKVGQFFENYALFFQNWDQKLFLTLMKERKLDLGVSFREYSRGQKMQAALVAALAIKPKLLLIDEITSVLDIWARKYFIEILKNFTTEGGTVLITTNVINEIQYATDQVIILNKGGIQLNEKLKDIPNKFIKIRNAKNEEHTIFKDPKCFWSGENSDGTFSYIVPITVAEEHSIPERLLDRRAVNLDELFIYFVKTGERSK
ncbi:MAG: ABC transporter ATP-binding protein [Oligoflexia bacterium]|nr:ABC transporter ATP-binding protein [Oligoflexia bacterium]